MADMVLAAWQRKIGKSWAMVWAIILEVKTHDKLLILKQKSPFGQYRSFKRRKPQSCGKFSARCRAECTGNPTIWDSLYIIFKSQGQV
jgi:hypothetical protein